MKKEKDGRTSECVAWGAVTTGHSWIFAESAEELKRQLLVAINKDRMRVTADGVPWW